MAVLKLEPGFLKSRAAKLLSAVLIIQAGLLYGFNRTEVMPTHKPLAEAPFSFGKWSQVSETPIEKDVQDVLKADDLLNRTYVSQEHRAAANLFVAFFKSQRTGQTPHSPKNCLPGSGWVPSQSDVVHVNVPGRAEPIEANRYVVSRADAKSLVLYWYQSRDRIVASEYTAKFYVVADAIRYNRTDTALVRVVIPMTSDMPLDKAQTAASDFIRDFYQPLRQHFPPA